MRFSATTVYSRDKLADFNKFVALEKKWFWIFLSVCTAITLSSFVLLLALGSFDKTVLFGLLLILFIDAFYSFATFVIPKIAVKKSPALDAAINFEFYSDVFSVNASTKTGKETAEHRYSVIIKARETKSVFYLYIAKQQAYIVDKSTLNPDSIEDFRTFLRNRNINLK
ncbi:MAG: YcxB family protein [Ruminococcaceae bacterium]|nr:YcxB family protein [Oscillospiraceae bacterium]